MQKTVREIIATIDAKVRPGLTGTNQILGFCTAMAAVLEEFGPETLIGDELVVARAVEGRICPDCDAVMVKRRATTEAGEIRVAWICDCDPENELTPAAAENETDETPTTGNATGDGLPAEDL